MTQTATSLTSPVIPGRACQKLIGDLQPTTLSQEDWQAGESKEIKKSRFLLLLVLLILGGVYLSLTMPDQIPKVRDDAFSRAISALGSIIVITLFVERSLQVYVNNMRSLNRQRLDLVIEGWTRVCDKVKPLSQPTIFSQDDLQYCEQQLQNWSNRRDLYRVKTGKIAFLAAIALGILIAAAGPRILVEIVEMPELASNSFRAMLFSTIDVLITGGLIGGGAEQLHHLMEMLTSHAKKATATP